MHITALVCFAPLQWQDSLSINGPRRWQFGQLQRGRYYFHQFDRRVNYCVVTQLDSRGVRSRNGTRAEPSKLDRFGILWCCSSISLWTEITNTAFLGGSTVRTGPI